MNNIKNIIIVFTAIFSGTLYSSSLMTNDGHKRNMVEQKRQESNQESFIHNGILVIIKNGEMTIPNPIHPPFSDGPQTRLSSLNPFIRTRR